MNRQKLITVFGVLLLFNCQGQTDLVVGGAFENRDFIYIGMPDQINATDTTQGWESGQKLMITGTVFQDDGVTPAKDIILYYYQTDADGYYRNSPHLDQRVSRHGYLRGWVKTDANGKYAIHTVRPGAYPNRNEPAHIHATIKEPSIDVPYYIDEFVFDDDRLLTTAKRRALPDRGGSGILRILKKGSIQIAEHNIVLGLNIPNYPTSKMSSAESGRNIGEDVFSFTPYHAWGPDKGTQTCPICKYGRYHGVLFFAGDNANWEDIRQWLIYLETESHKRQKYLKAYFIYGNEEDLERKSIITRLERLGQQLDLKYTALTLVPSFEDKVSEVYLNEINPKVENTFIIYRHSNIVGKYIDLKPNSTNFKVLSTLLDQTKGDYFDLNPPAHN